MNKLFIPQYLNSHTYILDNKKIIIIGISSYDFQTKLMIRGASGESFFELSSLMFNNFYTQINDIKFSLEDIRCVCVENNNNNNKISSSKRIFPLGENSIIKIMAMNKKSDGVAIKIVIDNYYKCRKVNFTEKEFVDFLNLSDILFYLISLMCPIENRIKEIYKNYVLKCVDKSTLNITPSSLNLNIENNEAFNFTKIILEISFICAWRLSADIESGKKSKEENIE